MFKVEKAKNNQLTLKYREKYIHSKYNPSGEVEGLINRDDIYKEEKIIIIGLGLGYHVKFILENYKEIKEIYIYELSHEVIELCKMYNQEIVKNSKVKIISGNRFYESLEKNMKTVKDILIYKGSLNYIKDLDNNLYNKLKWYLIKKESIKKESKLLIKNKNANLKVEFKIIDELIYKKNREENGKPWIVLSAGPSLDLEIENLKRNKDKFNIAAVGSAFRLAISKGIVPEFVVIIDGKESVYKQFEGTLNEKIPMCFLETASNKAVNDYYGEKYIFFNYNNNVSEYVIKTGKTVAVATLDIVLKCGAKKIVFLGQDLASIDGKTHIKIYEDFYDIKNDVHMNKTEKVKNVDGNFIYTEKGYIYFKEMIEEVILENKEIDFINCSKGVYIEGCRHLEFQEYLKGEKKL